MRSISAQFVNIPITGSYTSRTTDGRLYGSGEKAVIFSNMDTNNQSEGNLFFSNEERPICVEQIVCYTCYFVGIYGNSYILPVASHHKYKFKRVVFEV
jgi:hypothetical protein